MKDIYMDFRTPESLPMLLTLTVSTAFLLVWTAVTTLRRYKGAKPEDGGYLNVTWTSSYLPILDGPMLYWNIRKYGLLLVDQLVALNAAVTVGLLKVGRANVYFVRDLDIIQELLKSENPGNLEKPKEFYDFTFPGPLSDGLLGSTYSVWKPHRKAIAPAFSYRSLKTYFQYTSDCAQECIKKSLRRKRDGNAITQVEMRELLDYYGMKLTSQIVLGKAVSAATKQGRLNVEKALRIGKTVTINRFMNPFLLLPLVWRFHPQRLQQESAIAVGWKFCNEAIKLYRSCRKNKAGDNFSDNKNDTDKSTNVASIENKGEDDISFAETIPSDRENKSGVGISECILQHLIKSELSDKELIDEVLTFMAAGYETVRGALDLLIFQLALYPNCQRKCQEEVDAVLPASLETDTGISALAWEDLSKLKYLEQCILEGLRITPTVPVMARKLPAPMKLTSALTARQGDIVAILIWAVHRDAAQYENPEVFDPERFTVENSKKRHPYAYLPFSAGKRGCIDYKLALVQMKVFMAWIIRHYEFTTTDKPNDVKFLFSVTLDPERPYNILYKKRCV